MASKKVKTGDELAMAIKIELENVGTTSRAAAKRAIKRCANGVMETIKSHITFHDNGHYVKAFAIKEESDAYADRAYWHVRAPEYRKSAWLDRGHMKRGGKGRTRAYPHISFGDQ